MRVIKCLAQEHNTMSPARAQTRTARSGVERTNHEATAPPEGPNEARGIVNRNGKVNSSAILKALFAK